MTIKHLTLAAVLVAACLLSPSKGRAQPSGAGEDYFSPGYSGGAPLAPTPLVPQSTLDAAARAAEAQRRADELPRWQDYPRPAYHYPPPPDPEMQRRIEALQQQNQLLGQEWTQKILRDALRR